MVEMETTTKLLSEMLDSVSLHQERPVLIKYGSVDAKVSMKVTGIELTADNSVIIIVEA